MTIKFYDSDYWPQFEVTPENLAEVAKLFRLVNNTKNQKAVIYLNFSDDQPRLNIQFEKIAKSKQINSLKK